MEEKSRFAQILIFWDAVLLGTLIFISLSVKPGLRCLWLHSAMLAECAHRTSYFRNPHLREK